jgi:hypothetical protein
MFTVLKNGTGVIDCQDLQTAIRFVQTLESGLDRTRQHSPYTIVPTDSLADNQAYLDRPRVGQADFVCQITE